MCLMAGAISVYVANQSWTIRQLQENSHGRKETRPGLTLALEAVGAVCFAASLESCMFGVRKERPGHDGFAVLFFRGDQFIGRVAMFDPIDDQREPIEVSRARDDT